MNQTTMSHIFLVILSERSCCEPMQTTLRAFGEKCQAECYMDDMKHRMSFNKGLEEAVCRILEAGWDKEYPAPTRPSDEALRDDDTYNEFRRAEDAHYEARRVETDRLLALVGFDKTIPFVHDDSTLFIREVPFGFEVVKPEEVAQAAE
jgi:hypothetical protein